MIDLHTDAEFIATMDPAELEGRRRHRQSEGGGSMSDWITDRPPTADDADSEGGVWNSEGQWVEWAEVLDTEPWMQTNRPKAYVKPKRYVIRCYGDFGLVGPAGFWCVYDLNVGIEVTTFMSIEAAQHIAKAFNEVLP